MRRRLLFFAAFAVVFAGLKTNSAIQDFAREERDLYHVLLACVACTWVAGLYWLVRPEDRFRATKMLYRRVDAKVLDGVGARLAELRQLGFRDLPDHVEMTLPKGALHCVLQRRGAVLAITYLAKSEVHTSLVNCLVAPTGERIALETTSSGLVTAYDRVRLQQTLPEATLAEMLQVHLEVVGLSQEQGGEVAELDTNAWVELWNAEFDRVRRDQWCASRTERRLSSEAIAERWDRLRRGEGRPQAF